LTLGGAIGTVYSFVKLATVSTLSGILAPLTLFAAGFSETMYNIRNTYFPNNIIHHSVLLNTPVHFKGVPVWRAKTWTIEYSDGTYFNNFGIKTPVTHAKIEVGYKGGNWELDRDNAFIIHPIKGKIKLTRAETYKYW